MGAARPALGREKPSAGTVAWAISVKAQCAEARDIDNIALASAEASEQLDDMDLAEPPVIGEYVSLSFPHPEWESVLKRYCVDARPVPSSGEVWDMDVKSNMHDVVRLEFSNLETVPSGLDVRPVGASTPVESCSGTWGTSASNCGYTSSSPGPSRMRHFSKMPNG